MVNYKKYVSEIAALCIALSCLMSIFAPAAAAEGESQGFEGQGIGYASVLYDNSNGLPTSEANAVLQTKSGFVWIGSYSGLIRYDGNSFYRYDASVGISSVVSLYEDSQERLWIGTNDNGVALYKDGDFRFYGKVEGLKSSSIRSVAEDAEGNILIATTLGMAYIDGNEELHSLDDPQLNEEYICELRRGGNGVIYGETLSGGFFSIENMRVTAYYNGAQLGLGNVNCIAPDTENIGYVYLGTEESEIIYGYMNGGMKDCKKISVAPQVTINHITQAQGKIWICSDNGIGYLDENMNYTALNDIPMNNSVDSMTVDHEGNLWFASSRQGVMKIVPCRFTDISKIAGLGPLVVNTTCMYGGDLYVGTDTGLYVLDKNYQVKSTAMTELLKNIRIRAIKTDSKGNLWLCTYSPLGLVCLKGDGTYTNYNEGNGLTSNRVRTVEEANDGTIVVSTSGGLHFIRDGVLTDVYGTESGISNTEILSLCEGENGVLYLGSDGDGLYKVDGRNVTRMGLEDGLKSEVILRIKKDEARGIYWIITSNSIAYMKDDKITTVTSFPYSNNFDMFFDDNGGAWVLSSNGIYVTGVEQLLDDGEPEYVLYDTKCGLPSVATANSRSCLDEDGTLYISGAAGVSSININTAQSADSDIKLAVPFVEADDRLIAVVDGEDVVIPANCKRLIIYGYALTYSLTNPRVSYYLEGFDDEPQNILKQDMQPVSYTNLDGGEYVFHLSTINTLTGEEENAIAVTLFKQQAFYEQIWFRTLLEILAALLIFLAVRRYMKKKTANIVAREREKEEFIDEIIQAFAMCIDLKDPYTNGHSFRVAEYSRLIAGKLGYTDEEIKDIYNIALLHDIGKISIPDEVLNKPGKPTDEEYEILKTHPAKGQEILDKIKIAPNLAIGAGYHHERLDGKGYPRGLKGDEIPFIAQIIAVADTFDAMYSTRPYRKQLDIQVVRDEMKHVSGTQLNGEIVEKLTELIDEGIIGNEKL